MLLTGTPGLLLLLLLGAELTVLLLVLPVGRGGPLLLLLGC
jgi:hypothetical protein